MAKRPKRNSIEINGRLYDATTGEPFDGAPVKAGPKAASVSPSPKPKPRGRHAPKTPAYYQHLGIACLRRSEGGARGRIGNQPEALCIEKLDAARKVSESIGSAAERFSAARRRANTGSCSGTVIG